MMWACRAAAWGFDLDVDAALDVILAHYNPRCVPPWQPHEFGDLRRKCEEARSGRGFGKPLGWLLLPSPDWSASPPPNSAAASTRLASLELSGQEITGQGGGIALDSPPAAPVVGTAPVAPPGYEVTTPAESPEVNLDAIGTAPDDPFALARGFLSRYRRPDGLTLRFWESGFAVWRDGAYDRLNDEEIRGDVAEFVEWQFSRSHQLAVDLAAKNHEKGGRAPKIPTKPRVTRSLVGDVLQALAALCRLPSGQLPPCWVDPLPGDRLPPARECLALRSGILHLPTWSVDRAAAVLPATPRFVATNRVDVELPREAGNDPQPVEWLKFLADLWGDDADSIACLQEWFGYLLSVDTSIQKMLLILGAKRSGKGTILRVLKSLVGERNTVSPTLGQLAGDFGLAGLLDKTVAFVADARLSARDDAVRVTEQLLCISGEDQRTVNRKWKTEVTRKLDVRFVMCSNEMPRLGDASGAIVSRFCILHLTQSFLGREDVELLDRLLQELPAIFLWAIDGYLRITRTRRFTAPESAAEIMEDAAALCSPVQLWVDERCELGALFSEGKDDLFQSWKEWCAKTGRQAVGTRETFLRDLCAAVPEIKRVRVGSGRGEQRRQCYSGIRVLSTFEAGDVGL